MTCGRVRVLSCLFLIGANCAPSSGGVRQPSKPRSSDCSAARDVAPRCPAAEGLDEPLSKRLDVARAKSQAARDSELPQRLVACEGDVDAGANVWELGRVPSTAALQSKIVKNWSFDLVVPRDFRETLVLRCAHHGTGTRPPLLTLDVAAVPAGAFREVIKLAGVNGFYRIQVGANRFSVADDAPASLHAPEEGPGVPIVDFTGQKFATVAVYVRDGRQQVDKYGSRTSALDWLRGWFEGHPKARALQLNLLQDEPAAVVEEVLKVIERANGAIRCSEVVLALRTFPVESRRADKWLPGAFVYPDGWEMGCFPAEAGVGEAPGRGS